MNDMRQEPSSAAGNGVSVVLISFNEEKRIGACL